MIKFDDPAEAAAFDRLVIAEHAARQAHVQAADAVRAFLGQRYHALLHGDWSGEEARVVGEAVETYAKRVLVLRAQREILP